MNINFSLLFFFSILFLFFCSSSSSILHPISLSTRQEREVEKRRKKDKEEKRKKKSREKLIVVSLHSLSYFILFCFFILFSSFPHNSPTLLGFFPSSSLTRVGLGDMQRILQLVSPIAGSLFHRREPQRRIFSLASKFKMAYSERLLESHERLSIRDMRLRVAKLILKGVASSTIAQAEGYPSYTARELSSYFSYSSISISSKPEPESCTL